MPKDDSGEYVASVALARGCLLADDEWFEISEDLWLDPKFRPKRLKLLTDAQVPRQVVAEIRAAGLSVATLDTAGRRRSDPDVLRIAEAEHRVLLTLDAHFWDDHRFPLQSVRCGIIYVAEPPDSHDEILRAFGLVYGAFARSYPLDWWHSMKVKSTVGEFEIKIRTWEGKVARYRMTLRGRYLMAKEVAG